METILGYIQAGGLLLLVFFCVGMCIFVHELGHYLAAKLCGMHIDAFSIGFKKIWGKKINGIDYRIGCLPFGGYVELPQVDAVGIPKTADGVELPRAKPWQRIVTAFAGPFFNILFGLLLGCVIWIWGIPQDTPNMREIVVREVETDSPEYAAGLRSGDKIVKLNGKKFFLTWSDFMKEIIFTVDGVTLEVIRDGKTLEIKYQPDINTNAEELGEALAKEGMAIPKFKPFIPIELAPEANSPAAEAGLQKGDILTAINGKAVDGIEEMIMAINEYGTKKEAIVLTVTRNDESIQLPPIQPSAQIIGYQIGVFPAKREDGKTGLKINKVIPGSPASIGGFQDEDILLAVNGNVVNEPQMLTALIMSSKGAETTFQVERNGENLELKVTPAEIMYYSIGVSVTVMNHPNPFQQFADTLILTGRSLRGILISIGNVLHLTDLQSTVKPRHMSGPLGIGQTLYVVFRDGSLMLGLHFVVIVAYALAIFNLFPLPVLDGGHIFFSVLEMIFRRPLPVWIMQALTYTFVVLLISLMLYVTYFDLGRIQTMFSSGQPPAEPEANEVQTGETVTP